MRMTGSDQQRSLLDFFARLLSYPDRDTGATATDCLARLQSSCPEAAERLRGFAEFTTSVEPGRQEELFIATFELQSLCHPYVGYQLCGESQQRILFLMKLNEMYRQHGFAGTGELPDHLAELLRFIATVEDRACGDELIEDAVLPALEKIDTTFQTEDHPYRQLLAALRLWLAGQSNHEGVRP